VRLIIQPDAGISPLLKSIQKAKKSVKILIFRFDVAEIERALVDAVKRGVFVQALIAFTNRGGEKTLRDLEMRFLSSGITVARTSGDLVRYHGKMMIVDGKELHIMGFNFTHIDIDHSRSFAAITRGRELLREAEALFEADCKRQEYEGRSRKFIVSPANARKHLADFLKGAKKSLDIYDPKISDAAMLKILEERARDGVKVRVIGKTVRCSLPSRELQIRLHARTIIRDETDVFLGSQSLKKLELDSRREIGVIFRDLKIAKKIASLFDDDWSKAKKRTEPVQHIAAGKAAKKVAKAVAKKLPVKPVVEQVVKAVHKKNGNRKLDSKQMEKAVQASLKKIVQETVQDTTRQVVQDMVEEIA
jgi:phosphatidylserine/phosphatidylglycerophosphate/cardiolipin synthase-like enzyme